MMTTSELRQKDRRELIDLLEAKRRDLWNFRFGASGSKVRNVKEGKLLRQEISRIMTVLSSLRPGRQSE